MSTDPSNNSDAERLFTEALRLDPSNETVLTMFAIFKCNRYVPVSVVRAIRSFDICLSLSLSFSSNRNEFEEAANLYERAIKCTRGEEKLMQYAALLYAIRAQGRAIKRLSLHFPGGFPPAGGFANLMGGMV